MLPAGFNAPAMRSASCGVISAAQAVLRTKMFPRRAGSETSERPIPFARARPWRSLYSHAERLALPIASTRDAPGPVTSGRDDQRTASGRARVAIVVFPPPCTPCLGAPIFRHMAGCSRHWNHLQNFTKQLVDVAPERS